MSENMKWYTLHVYSSMEKSVKNALEERIARSDLRESFGQVLLPIERVQEVRNGRKVTSERRMYPGYVFIEMEMNDATWHLVNSTPRVIEFLGNNNPVVLSDAEVANIMNAASISAEKPRPKIEFEIGEQVRVKSGAFKDFTGRVDAVDYDKSRLNVYVSIFGRDTPVDLAFNEVEKI
ncbi:MAG: transcription termination/antitermination protein NusG [Sutterella parvirubra]|jgi:transcriptional antiterminator NusG|uniref:Transcription termination/antitermination protein NusG n=1 Tax=Sutterella parvirubra YIT 11816 TaxID=762967 RepID=H3KBT3_9BURK|nr:transcription termination/antitermination protein NusG [Sutterella parvirubra]EHY32420.1 transcription termination/antitermination factor NusG [Sutterella parvirubra YIT 11816]MDR3770094.1 transcription termination/antitermination protein NusG [Sutterella sp.]MDY5201296.1 transcription termination/antitermination protein NusG [Sutterella parvirubra]